MDQPPYAMDRSRRETVLAALRVRCCERHWNLLAAHVRTRWLWKPEQVSAAIRYVVNGQGDAMAVFEKSEA